MTEDQEAAIRTALSVVKKVCPGAIIALMVTGDVPSAAGGFEVDVDLMEFNVDVYANTDRDGLRELMLSWLKRDAANRADA